MYLKKVEGKRFVTLPDGTVLTHADLPPVTTQRWVASRKLTVVRAVAHGLITQAEAESMYSLSEEEFLFWIECVKDSGLEGLKVTRQKQ